MPPVTPGSAQPDVFASVGALAEPTRRALYEYVAAATEPVGRDEAAAALDIGRPLAAFHLDRLVVAGLLEADYRRRNGRRGPGAGRPAKLYRRAPATLEVSVPPRRYELAAGVFAQALEEADGTALEVLLDVARARGRALGRHAAGAPADGAPADGASAAGAPAAGAPAAAPRALDRLAELGFEPVADGPVIRLRNCPFAVLSQSHRDVTCPMNLALLQGFAEVTGGLSAEADATPGYCCVALFAAPERPGAASALPGSVVGSRQDLCVNAASGRRASSSLRRTTCP